MHPEFFNALDYVVVSMSVTGFLHSEQMLLLLQRFRTAQNFIAAIYHCCTRLALRVVR